MRSDPEVPDSSATAALPSVAHDVVWTALTSAVLLVGNLLTLALLAHRGAETVFAPYSLARRLAVGLLPALCIGMNLGLVRYLPGRGEPDRDRLLREALGLFVLAVAVATAAIAVLRPLIAASLPLLRGADTYWATWINIIATAVVAMMYALFRGEIRQGRANTLNLLSVTIVPLAVVLVAPAAWGAAPILMWTGLGTLVAVLACSATRLVRAFSRVPEPAGERPSTSLVRPMLKFSLPRAPALVAIGLMMVVGPWVASSSGGAGDASYLLAGFAFAQGVSTAVGALALVLMPRVAGFSTAGLEDRNAGLVEKALHANLLLAVVATPLLVFQARTLVQVWLGPGLVAGTPVVQLVLLGVPGILSYYLLSAVSDGALSRPLATEAASAGLLVCLVGSLMWRGSVEGIASAFALGQTVAAGILLAGVSQRFKTPLHVLRLAGWAVASIVAAAGIGWLGRAGSIGSGVELGLAIMAGVVLTSAAVWFAPTDMGLRATVARVGGGWHAR